MSNIWIGTVEVLVNAGDLPSGLQKAFVNVTAWAASESMFTQKVADHLEKRCQWRVVSVEYAAPVEPHKVFNGTMNEMIRLASANPGAVVLGKAFSYADP